METKQEWEEIEAKWNRFVAEAGLHKSGEGIKAALQSLGNELRAAYQRLKQAICAACPLQFLALSPTIGGRRTHVTARPNERSRPRQVPALRTTRRPPRQAAPGKRDTGAKGKR